VPTWNTGGCGTTGKINVSGRIGEDMVVLKRELVLKKITGKPEDPGNPPRTKLTVFGEEVIEKEVKPGGNAGRIYLPLDWVGKLVKIIRTD
jgi:putative transposon-encoded protein